MSVTMRPFSSRQEDVDGDCANRALALQAEYLPLEFLRWEVREHESNVACNVRSAGEGDRGITEPGNCDFSVRKIKSENPLVDRDTSAASGTVEQAKAKRDLRAEKDVREWPSVQDCVR